MRRSECELCGEGVLIVMVKGKEAGADAADTLDIDPQPAVAEVSPGIFGRVVVHTLHRRTCIKLRGGAIESVEPPETRTVDPDESP